MTFLRVSCIFSCVLAGMFLAGCGGSDDGGGGGSSSSLPELLPFVWITAGGGGGATIDGGTGGNIEFLPAGDIMLDDGRARPTIGTNFLSASVMTDGIVTYSELTTLQTPTTAGTLATFTLGVGTGFELPGGVTLDLSDAPAGTVDAVEISSQAEIAIYGSVVLTRAGADACELRLGTTAGGLLSIVIEGSIDGRGAPTFNGANVSITGGTTPGSGGPVAFLSPSVDLSGGVGDAANAGGNGGDLLVQTGSDLLLPYGSFDTRGGAGTDAGGSGGLVRVEVQNNITAGALLADLRWGANTSGGSSGTGNAGAAGDVTFTWGTGAVAVWSRVIAVGGTSTGIGGAPEGGAAGDVSMQCIFNGVVGGSMGGTAYISADAGSSASGSGASGGAVLLSTDAATDLILRADSRGGDGGAFGGDGGSLRIQAVSATNCTVRGDVSGGAGGNGGGTGGSMLLGHFTPTGSSSLTSCLIEGTAAGGASSGGTGGNGGIAMFGNFQLVGTPVAFTATDCRMNLDAPGGDGSDGGSGGQMRAGHHQGTMAFTFSGNLDGGNGVGTGADINGGLGGMVRFATATGTATLSFATVSADGGDGASVSGSGGAGGTLEFDADAGSITVVAVAVSLDGGDGTGTGVGGTGGSADFDTLGAISFSGAFVSTGGAGGTDGAGGNFVVVTPGAVMISANLLTFGGGTAGSGGSIDIGNNQAATITVTSTSRLRANAATPSGSAGNITLDAVGTGSPNPNLTVQAGAVLETLNGAGVNVNNIVTD